MGRLLAVGLAAFAVSASDVRPEGEATVLPYVPLISVAGTIRITGDAFVASVVAAWRRGFQIRHPNANVKATLLGTGTALAGLYTRTSDLAIMGRALTSVEHDAYTFAFNKAEPLGIEVMTGSRDKTGKSAALIVFVQKDNPLARLTLAQLDGIIGTEHRRGAENLRTWGQLGLSGEWADQPIRVYIYDQKSGPGAFIDARVTNGSSKWDWERVREFKDIAWNADGFACAAGKQIVAALAKDRYGIGVATLRDAHPDLRPLALAEASSGPYVEATPATMIARTYPLTRAIYIFLNRAPGKPIEPAVREFLRYVLSREGQADIGEAGDFLPLSAELDREQLGKLE